ncbi:Uu.00g057210.m01.CDS01 [Anthostomella pinea]|uniref:Uu.00g057210.m01.CDS01 n=1 Tax=Anthostomella pinea TaxID=933095 RepID=A0AAI8VRK1_9PEZI|nr:Uu.00g057210.m01.CDS01 [Anthostomella pinea]
MADFLKNILGGSKPSETPAASADSDFADFAEAPSPTPVPFQAVPSGVTLGGPAPTDRPYTKWYNVHERYGLSDFRAEGVILSVIAILFTLHYVGTKLNRAKSKAWIKANGPVLTSEYATVGFGGSPNSEQAPDKLLKEKSLFEYSSYATGRQNVAFTDIKLSLIRRFNPLMTFAETVLSFFLDSYTSPVDSVEVTIYPFDGKEAQIVPAMPGAAELRSKDSKSSFDGFVWALVNKDLMKQLRDERYDVSITFTKDNNKLPNWTTVMSESAEITNLLLTDELVSAIKKAGDLFDYIIISDQPVDKPKTMDETVPRKRIFLKYRLPSSNNYDDLLPLFSYFLRIPDQLASSAHFRPEVMRKVKSVRDENVRQIQKEAELEKAEERALERDKAKKVKRDAELNALDARAQKKFLEKERDKEQRKASKKQTVRQ